MKLEPNILKQIVKEIEIDNLNSAISELQESSYSSDVKAQLILLKGRLQELDRKQTAGVIDRADYVTERNQIRTSLLDLVYIYEKQNTSLSIEEQFIEYANEMIDMYESRDIKKHFIRPELIKGDHHITYFELLEKIQSTDKQLTLILGNFGSGKSVLMKDLFYQFLKEFLKKKSPIPIFIKLKTHKIGEDIQDFIARTLVQRYNINIDRKTLIKAQMKGKFIFIFDGFDEMLGKVNTASLREGVQQIENLLSDGISKLVASCRTHFFYTSFREDIIEHPNKYYIRPWNASQISLYLEKRMPIKNSQIFDFIENTYNLSELAKTPLFLEMIVESLNEDLFSTKIEINSASLYHYYTEKWFSATVVRKGTVMTEKQKKELVEELAWQMVCTGKYIITLRELRLIILDKFSIDKKETIENFLYDIINCSFLIREGDFFEFSHASFVEYFVALKSVDDISRDKYDSFDVPLRSQIYIFCADILKNTNISINYNTVLKQNYYCKGSIICIAYRIQDEDSKRFFQELMKQKLHPGNQGLIATSIVTYPFEFALKILLELFYNTNNSIVKLTIQIYFRYLNETTIKYNDTISNIVKEKIIPTHKDARDVLDDNPLVVMSHLLSLKLRRLNLKKDDRWIITVHTMLNLTMYNYKEIIPLLEYYTKNSEVEPVVETAKQCLQYFSNNEQ